MSEIKCCVCGATPEHSEDIYSEHDGGSQHRHLYQCVDFLQDSVISLRAELERVKAESELIPCEVRMPDGKRNLLVTNNLEARDVFGEMSHIWLVTNIYMGENGKYSAFDESMQRIHGIKYWRYALPTAPEEGE